MFEVGFGELVLLAIVALLVFGPEKMPGLVRDAAYWIGRIRRYVAAAKADIDRELAISDLKRSLAEHAAMMQSPIDSPQNDEADAEPVSASSATIEPHAQTSHESIPVSTAAEPVDTIQAEQTK